MAAAPLHAESVHRLRHADEACNVCAQNIIARRTIFISCLHAAIVNVAHILASRVSVCSKVQLSREEFCRISRADVATPPAFAALPDANNMPASWNRRTASGVEGMFAPSPTAITPLSIRVFASLSVTSPPRTARPRSIRDISGVRSGTVPCRSPPPTALPITIGQGARTLPAAVHVSDQCFVLSGHRMKYQRLTKKVLGQIRHHR